MENKKNNFELWNKFKITDSAFKQINNIIKEKDDKLRLIIKKSGCFGYIYDIEIIKYSLLNNKNEVLFIYKNIEIYILKKYINIINNTELDYIKEGFNYKFVFNNPNIKNTCGCGKSFNI